METIERNDVDISKLFIWKRKVEIKGDNNDVVFTGFMRLAGDADINRARVAAIRESAKLRDEIKSDEDLQLAYFIEKDGLTSETLIEHILTLVTKKFTEDSIGEVDFPLPREPDDNASLEEQERYQKLVDEYPNKRWEKIRTLVLQKLEKYKENLSKKSFDELYKIYTNHTINIICENRLVTIFREYCVFYSVYIDESLKNHLFNNFEDFTNLPSHIKSQFLDEYSSLEISLDELKK